MDLRTPKNKTKLLKIYKLMILFFVLVLILSPKSVTNRPEIETKLLLTSIGLDKVEDQYRVSATAVMPQESQNGSTMRLNVGVEADSVSAAFEKLSLKMGKKLELGLCGLIVIGDTFGDESILPHLNYLMASGKIIPGAYLVLSLGKSAKETIEMSNMLSEASSNGLSKLIEHNALDTNMPSITLLKFLSETGSVTKSSYIPCIEIGKKDSGSDQEKPSDGGSDEGQSSGSGEDKKGETEIKSLSKIAFYRDGRQIKFLDDEQTRGFTWSDKTSTQGLVSLENLKVQDIEVGQIFCQLRSKKFKIKTGINNGVPQTKMSVEVLLELEDRYKLSDLFKYYGISEEEINQNIKNQFAVKIENELVSVINVMKECDCDAMGLTTNLYKFHYNDYNNYPDKENILSAMQVDYDIKVKFK
jgi:hypothetical protein